MYVFLNMWLSCFLDKLPQRLKEEKWACNLDSSINKKKTHRTYLAIVTQSVPSSCSPPSQMLTLTGMLSRYRGLASWNTKSLQLHTFVTGTRGLHGLQCLGCVIRIRVISMSFLKGPSRNSESKQNQSRIKSQLPYRTGNKNSSATSALSTTSW